MSHSTVLIIFATLTFAHCRNEKRADHVSVADRKFLDSLDYTILNYDSIKFETGKGLFPDDYSAADVTPKRNCPVRKNTQSISH